MGLDMYLYARRHAMTAEVTEIERAISLPERPEYARDFDEDGEMYVSGWDHMPDPAYAPLLALCGVNTDLANPSLDLRFDGEGYTLEPMIGYWRKTNAVHRFFVEQAQGGVDECQTVEVSRELLLDLLTRCMKIIGEAELVDGIVRAPVTFAASDDTAFQAPSEVEQHESTRAMTAQIMQVFGIDPAVAESSGGYEEGKVLADPTLAAELLPTQEGFFFGDTGYDEDYVHDIAHTALICARCLDLPSEWSFSYRSSW